jgi:hypothetical protein
VIYYSLLKRYNMAPVLSMRTLVIVALEQVQYVEKTQTQAMKRVYSSLSSRKSGSLIIWIIVGSIGVFNDKVKNIEEINVGFLASEDS